MARKAVGGREERKQASWLFRRHGHDTPFVDRDGRGDG